MEGDVSLELEQEWDDAKECIEYLRRLASSVEESVFFRDKQIYLGITKDENDDDSYTIYLMTL